MPKILSQSATRTSQRHAARAHRGSLPIHRARVSRRQFHSGCSRSDGVCRHTRFVSLSCRRSARKTRYRSCHTDSHDTLHRRSGLPRAGAAVHGSRFRFVQRLRLPRDRRHRASSAVWSSGRIARPVRRARCRMPSTTCDSCRAGSRAGTVTFGTRHSCSPESTSTTPVWVPGTANPRLQSRYHAERSVLDEHRAGRSCARRPETAVERLWRFAIST